MADVVLRPIAGGDPIRVPEELKGQYLAMSDNQGKRLYKTAAGKSLGFDVNDRGERTMRSFTDLEIWQRGQAGKDVNILAIKGSPDVAEASNTNIKEGRRRFAEASPGQAFLTKAGGLGPVAVAPFIDEGVESLNELEEGSPVAAGLGTATNIASQFLGPSLVAKGVTKLGGPTARQLLGLSDDVTESLARTATDKISNTGLLGVAESAGAKVTSALSSKEVPSFGAKLAGGAVRSVLTDLPISAQLTIADVVDGDVPTTMDAIASQVGFDVMFGGFFELGARGLGSAATLKIPRKLAGKAAGSTIGSKIIKETAGIARNVVLGKVAGAIVPQGGGFVNQMLKRAVFKVGRIPVLKRWMRNPASRSVSAVRGGDDFVRSHAAVQNTSDLALDNLSKLSRTKFREVVDAAAANAGSVGDDMAALTRAGAERAPARIIKASSKAGGSLEDFSSLYKNHAVDDFGRPGFRENFIDPINTSKLDYSGTSTKQVKAHFAPAIHQVRRNWQKMGANAKDLKRLDDLEKSVRSVSSPAGVSRKIIQENLDIQDFVRRGEKGSRLAPFAESWQKDLGQFMRDENIWGTAGTQHGQVMDAISDIIDAQAGSRSGNLDDAFFRNGVTPEDIAETIKQDLRGAADLQETAAYRGRDALVDMREAMDSLRDGGVISKKAHANVVNKLERAIKDLDSVVDDIDVVVAANNLAAKQGVEGLGTSHALAEAADTASSPPSTLETTRMGMESVGAIFKNLDEALDKVEASFSGRFKVAVSKTAGFIHYRQQDEESKRRTFGDARELVKTLEDPAVLESQLKLSLDRINSTHPQWAAELGQTAVIQAMYLIDALPETPIDLFGSEEVEAPITDIDSFMEKYITLDEPETAYLALAEGTLTEDMVDALRNARPNIYAFMQSELANMIATTDKDIPYASRISLANFLGSGIEPTLDANFVLSLQSTSAQTGPQEQAVRSPSQREPGIAQQAGTALSRVENF